jgi:hypothetical protein
VVSGVTVLVISDRRFSIVYLSIRVCAIGSSALSGGIMV